MKEKQKGCKSISQQLKTYQSELRGYSQKYQKQYGLRIHQKKINHGYDSSWIPQLNDNLLYIKHGLDIK